MRKWLQRRREARIRRVLGNYTVTIKSDNRRRSDRVTDGKPLLHVDLASLVAMLDYSATEHPDGSRRIEDRYTGAVLVTWSKQPA